MFLVFLISIVHANMLYGFKWLNFTFNSTADYNYYILSNQYQEAVPTCIRMDLKGNLYFSVPRNSASIPATFTKLFLTENETLLSPFPSWWSNSYLNAEGFSSIIAFEIDPSDNFWLLDQGKNALFMLNENGTLLNTYDLSPALSANSLLQDLALDLFRNFAYISDSGTPGILVLNLSDASVRMVMNNHSSVMPDQSFWLTINNSRIYQDPEKNQAYSVGVSGMALSCDFRDLYYAPVTSRELYAISTQYIRNNSANYSQNIMNLGFKKTASQGIAISERGNMYLTDLQFGNVLYYEQMTPYPLYFLSYFLRPVLNDSNVIWPYSVSFNNVNRSMLVLANQFQNYKQKTIDFDVPMHGDYNFYVFEVYVDDRSYLYGCHDVVLGHSTVDIPVWIVALISIMTLIIFTIIICAIKHYRMIKRRHGTLIYN